MIFPKAFIQEGKDHTDNKIIKNWKSRLDRDSKNTIGIDLLYPREGESAAKNLAAYQLAASAIAKQVLGIIDFNINSLIILLAMVY